MSINQWFWGVFCMESFSKTIINVSLLQILTLSTYFPLTPFVTTLATFSLKNELYADVGKILQLNFECNCFCRGKVILFNYISCLVIYNTFSIKNIGNTKSNTNYKL